MTSYPYVFETTSTRGLPSELRKAILLLRLIRIKDRATQKFDSLIGTHLIPKVKAAEPLDKDLNGVRILEGAPTGGKLYHYLIVLASPDPPVKRHPSDKDEVYRGSWMAGYGGKAWTGRNPEQHRVDVAAWIIQAWAPKDEIEVAIIRYLQWQESLARREGLLYVAINAGLGERTRYTLSVVWPVLSGRLCCWLSTRPDALEACCRTGPNEFL